MRQEDFGNFKEDKYYVKKSTDNIRTLISPKDKDILEQAITLFSSQTSYDDLKIDKDPFSSTESLAFGKKK